MVLLWAAALPAWAASLPDFTSLARNNGAAVVNISTVQTPAGDPSVPFSLPGLPEGHPLEGLLNYFFGQQDDSDRRPFEIESLGSGFIIGPEGYVLTNRHVVADAREIRVRLSNRQEWAALLVGSDPDSDIALLKITATGLPVVTIGRSRDLQVGEWVLAIGSPFGFEQSATAGIVSAIGRSFPEASYIPFIQTDVAINPGNSGSPLFNMRGEVVGINSQIYSRTGSYMGLSFAIPIEIAMAVAEQLKTKGRVSRGWLGVSVQEMTHELAESLGMSRPQGALITQVVPTGPAAAAGMQPGDVVVEFDGQPVEVSSALPPLVGMARSGETITIKLIRVGQPLLVQVRIEELPEPETASAGPEASAISPVDRLGLRVSEVPPALREAWGLGREGVWVETVEDGPAARAGIRRGDVILIIKGQRIEDSQAFARLVQDLPAESSVPVLVQRHSGPEFLALRIPER